MATGLENLFAHEPELPNVQKIKMPENTDKWAESLTTITREQFPDVATLPIEIEFRRKDEKLGVAIGSIHIINMDVGKSIYVPFIIEKFLLHPLDIWMEKKTQSVHPLTKDTFKEQFFTPMMSDGLDARPADSMGNYFNDPSMWTTTYPPLQGRYSYASAGYQILDEISDTMTEADLNTFKSELKSEPMLLAKFERNGHKEIIQKLAAKKGVVNTMDYGASAEKLIPTSSIQVKREGYDKYSILSMADGMFDLATSVKMDRNTCADFLSKIIGKPQDFMTEVDQNGEKMAILKPAPKKGVWLYDKDEQKAVNANEFNCYLVKNKNGLMIEALVIPDVVNYEGKKMKGVAVLSRTHSSFQPQVAGIPAPHSQCAEKVLKTSNVRTGQTGLFVYVGKNGKAIATTPITIRAVEDGRTFDVTDLNGKKFKVKQGWGNEFRFQKEECKGLVAAKGKDEDPQPKPVTLESLGFVEVSPSFYIIPEKMVWIPMEPMTELAHTPNEWLEKTAMHNMDMDPVRVRYTGIVYEFSGGNLPKIAASEEQAKGLLINLGADMDKIAHILKKAKYVGKCTIHGAAKLKSKKEINEEAKKAVEKISAACVKMKKSLVKAAAEVDDTATIDVLLGLNFITPENLAKFISYLPLLEKCADYLAELTLASRLGIKQISASSAAGAMAQVLAVVEDLKRVSSSLKKPTTKVA